MTVVKDQRSPRSVYRHSLGRLPVTWPAACHCVLIIYASRRCILESQNEWRTWSLESRVLEPMRCKKLPFHLRLYVPRLVVACVEYKDSETPYRIKAVSLPCPFTMCVKRSSITTSCLYALKTILKRQISRAQVLQALRVSLSDGSSRPQA